MQRILVALTLSLGLAGMAAPVSAAVPAAVDPGEQTARQVADALRRGDVPAAQKDASLALARDPRDARAQFLNGLAYHLEAEQGAAGDYDLARVGYETSLRFDPNAFWPDYLLGVLEFERGNWRASQARFASAALKAPDDWRALTGLAAASYYAGDAGLASLAAERGVKLAPHEPQALRVAALAADAVGDDKAAKRFADAYNAAGGEHAQALARRIDELRRTADVDNTATPALPPAAAASPDQMLVEVTIILAEDTDETGFGVNLLDGLRLQYSYDNTQTLLSGDVVRSFIRTVTQKIAIPEVDYNLNIFNRSREIYHVLARPTLTAFLNQPSDFFAGRQSYVQVSGVNLGQLQMVEAGVRLKLIPLAIGGDRVKFHIEAERSFFSPAGVGTFDKQINVFKQSVAATAEIDYGQTLILSGLSESFLNNTRSLVPGLGELPGPNAIFSRRDGFARQTSVMILVTPSPPLAADAPRRISREGVVARVAQLWTTVVEPTADLAAVIDRLQHARFFSRADRGDLSVAGARDPGIIGEALASLGASTERPSFNQGASP